MIDNNTAHILISSLSVSCATVITHPLDLVKVRLQLLTIAQSTTRALSRSSTVGLIISPRMTFSVAKDIIHNEKLSGLFKGWIPALSRAFIYGGARLGLYAPIKNTINNIYDVNNNTVINITSALLSGALAAVIGNPLEVLKVRLQSGNNYSTHIIPPSPAYRCITTSSLYSNLWNGTSMSATRAAILTASQIGPYTTLKHYLKDNIIISSDLGVTVVSALISGIVSTTLTSPFDVIKTKLMANTINKGYTVNKVTKDLLTNEGIMALFKGWLPNYTRLGPQTMVTFIVYEQLNKLYNGINTELNVF